MTSSRDGKHGGVGDFDGVIGTLRQPKINMTMYLGWPVIMRKGRAKQVVQDEKRFSGAQLGKGRSTLPAKLEANVWREIN
jgi:hypothetical protein